MNWIIPLLFGVLIGWLFEWVIDWLYWRKKRENCQQELLSTRMELNNLKAQMVAKGIIELDDFQKIVGIGPVIEKKLHEAGIYSYMELASVTPQELERIVGVEIRNLSDEVDIINQAKKLSKKGSKK